MLLLLLVLRYLVVVVVVVVVVLRFLVVVVVVVVVVVSRYCARARQNTPSKGIFLARARTCRTLKRDSNKKSKPKP